MPDAPPGNLVAGTVSGIADRVGDTIQAGAGSAAPSGDLVATIRDRRTLCRADSALRPPRHGWLVDGFSGKESGPGRARDGRSTDASGD